MRLGQIQATGVDMPTSRIRLASIKEMLTKMDYTSSIEDVKYVCSVLDWDLKPL